MHLLVFVLLMLFSLQGTQCKSTHKKSLRQFLNSLKTHQNAKEALEKILNGQIAHFGQFPFMVSLEYDTNHFCGGSAISDYWVLTAAHCVDGPINEESINVRVGSLLSEQGGSLHRVEVIIPHQRYDSNTMVNDIALIKVRDSLLKNSYVRAIRLHDPDEDIESGEKLVAAGWGMTSGGWGPISEELRTVELDAVTNEFCNEAPAMERLRQYAPIEITDGMMCAATEGKDTCKGDSGGPLMIEDEDDADDVKLIQVGVVSWGIDLGSLESPGVYTRVAQYRKWIYLNSATLPN